MSPTSSTLTSALEESEMAGYLLPLCVRSGGLAETAAVVTAPSMPSWDSRKTGGCHLATWVPSRIPITSPSHRALHVFSFWDLIAAGGIWVILQEGPPVFSVVAGMSDLNGTSFASFSDRCLAVAPWLKWCSAEAPMVASSPSTWLLASPSPLPSWWLAKCLVRPRPQPQFSVLASLSNKCLGGEQRGRGHPSARTNSTSALGPLETKVEEI